MSDSAPTLEVVVTARPSWARVKHIVLNYAKLYGEDKVTLSLVGPALSKRYGDLSGQLPNWLQFYRFPSLQESDHFESIALTCLEGANALVRHWSQKRPDCVLVVADRTETLGVALGAALMQIPLIHLQGGEISGSIDDKVRDTNSKLADLHLTTNQVTAQRLIDIGESDEIIEIVGCPSLDIVNEIRKSSDNSLKNEDLIGVGNNFSIDQKFGIIMFHPDTLNEPENILWTKALIKMVEKSNLNWFWFWPNPDHGTNSISKEIRRSRESASLQKVKFIINLPPENFVKLILKCSLLVGNSSFGIREASYIGLPVINLGNRQAGRQRAENVLDIESLKMVDRLNDLEVIINSKFESSRIYGSGNSGLLAAQIIGKWQPRVKKK
jgi:UDP-hydrolysing UDP-N-acetyl-D-glucosamine 2-epimerase